MRRVGRAREHLFERAHRFKPRQIDAQLLAHLASRGGKRVAGIVQYAPAPIANSGGGGRRRGRKRKAAEGLSGLLSDVQLEQWLQEVGSSDAMLEGLLGL